MDGSGASTEGFEKLHKNKQIIIEHIRAKQLARLHDEGKEARLFQDNNITSIELDNNTIQKYGRHPRQDIIDSMCDNFMHKYLFILELLCSPSNRESIIGDLVEACGDVSVKYGKRRALIYFYVQYSKTIFALLYGSLRRLFLWLLGAVGFDWIIHR